MIGYHASRNTLTAVHADLCITPSEDRALDYLERADGWLHTIEVSDSLRLADEDDLRTAAETLWGDVDALYGYTPYPYELADDADLRDVLADAGFDGIEYEDQTERQQSHDCIRIFDAAHVRIATATAVSA